MKLLVVRHAPAEDRVRFARTGLPDAERPLTDRGRRKMATAARGLARLLRAPAVLATSPYARAVETAEALRCAYGGLPLTRLSVLAPGGRREDLLAWLAGLDGLDAEAIVAVVGHEPDLGELVASLVTGTAKPLFALKKAGACLVGLPNGRALGAASLEWLMTPAQLRKLAR